MTKIINALASIVEPDPVYGRVIAWDRDEADACECSTPGCAINHSAEASVGDCEGW